MAAPPDPLPALPDIGRRFHTRRRVRLSDVDPSGRMRLDAIARWLQDIAHDDVSNAGLDEPAWVVRRTRIRAQRFPRYLEEVSVATYCWSMGSRYAERRTTLLGNDDGGAVDTLTLWVRLDPATGRPTELSEAFRNLYEVVVAGRRTRPRLELPDPPADGATQRWPVRHADLDMLGHVNNSVYWTAVEELLAQHRHPESPRDFEMEFRAPIDRATPASLLQRREDDVHWLWLVTPGQTHAAGVLWPADAAADSAANAAGPAS